MNKRQLDSNPYSFMDGGYISNLGAKIGRFKHSWQLAIAGVIIAWVPLVLLTALEGTLYTSVAQPFIADLAMHGRFLVALPLLILITRPVNVKTTAVIKHISDTMLSHDAQDTLINETMPRIRLLAASWVTEIVLLLFIAGSLWGILGTDVVIELQHGSTWKYVGAPSENVISLGGKWAAFVSIPFFQFLLLQWIWRYAVWTLLLFRISRMPLRLLHTHADRAGGLGIIIIAQRTINFIFLACAIVVSSQLLMYISTAQETMTSMLFVAIGFIIFCLLILMIPVLFFLIPLIRTRQKGLLELSRLSVDLSATFEKEWINSAPIEERIDNKHVDPSMAFDYASLYDLVEKLRIVPVTTRDVSGMVILLIIPFLPILFVYYSAAEILEKILNLLL